MDLEKELNYHKLERTYIKSGINWHSFDDIGKYCDQILNRKIHSAKELEQLIFDYSELRYVFSERGCRLFINSSCSTNDNKKQREYQYHISVLNPESEKYIAKINKRFINLNKLYPLGNEYQFFIKKIDNHIKLFDDKNLKLQEKDTILFNQYTKLQGNLIFEFNNKKQTLQQMQKYLESPDRDLRKNVYEIIWSKKIRLENDISDIFSNQRNIRNEIAKNLKLPNYISYKFLELERFDYTPNDCLSFHNAIKKIIVPVNEKLALFRKEKLGIDKLKPFDLDVDIYGYTELKPFNNVDELVDKSFQVFDKINPSFTKILKLMHNKKMLDLESREGKSPGGYMMPLAETKLPFIFMNSVGINRNLVTFMHEAGHAINYYLVRNEKVYEYRSATSEIDEVASMSMELITMEHWDIFYPDRIDFVRAQLRQLESIIKLFPWIVAIDSFQHWIYSHVNITVVDLINKWNCIYNEVTPYVDYSGYEQNKSLLWQSQLHIFRLPFYYIEYAIAQLGAFNLWINYKKDKKATIDKFIECFSLGGRKPLPDLFKTAGILFDFSEDNLKKIVSTIQHEIENLIEELKILEEI